jgi:two-component system cell cycle sensor histidine kinase/response regulator CckA
MVMQPQLALLGNSVISLAYAAISAAIVVPLMRAGQLATNRLATATALIFFSCSIGHGFHALGAAQVLAGATAVSGMTMPMPSTGWGWPSAIWDLLTASAGVYYWSLRRGYGALLDNGALYADPGQQRRLDEMAERERRVERHRALLAAVVQDSEDSIVTVGIEGTVIAWNVGSERMYGYTADEMVGEPVSLLAARTVPADAAEAAGCDIIARVVAGERGIRYDSRRMHRDGSVLDVSVAVSPVLDDHGEVVGVSSITRDVTAAKQAESDLHTAEERANHAQHMASLGQLAGGVAHDFNNLLGIILNYTAFAAEPGTDSAGLQADLTQVRTAAERAVGLTGQLLTFTRQDTIRPETLDINASIAEAQAMLSRTIGEHIELIALPSPVPLMIYADAGHIQQILVNLAINARDAMPDGGTLVIEATAVELDDDQPTLRPTPKPGRYVRLLVSDTGTGMSRETIAHLFEPFFTTKPQGKGTGLGLATVYGIVINTGGSVNVYSEPELGTTFRVYFPLVMATGDVAAAEPDTTNIPRGHGQTVLVVEDEPALALSVARILNEGGYRAVSANGGTEALALDAKYGCDLLLTDLVMPEMSGRRIAEQLTERHRGLPVLYMSGYASGLLDTAHVLDNGIAFIEKPFTARLLLGEVNNVFTATEATPAAEPNRSP